MTPEEEFWLMFAMALLMFFVALPGAALAYDQLRERWRVRQARHHKGQRHKIRRKDKEASTK